jgi:hypothetical protein
MEKSEDIPTVQIDRPKQTLLHKTHKQDLLMESLIKYYFNNKKINSILNIINGISTISLRVLDWFVTNYSKKNNIIYLIKSDIDNTSRLFNVYLDYKQQLKGYSKKQFDPFCRRGRIQFYYNNTEYITTTVGQLNFFRWANNNNILEYIKKNVQTIEKDMNESYKNQYGTVHKKSKQNDLKLKSVNVKIHKQKPKRKKRHELSKSACKSVTKYNTRVTLLFD